MEPFEYVVVLSSLILGLRIAQLLTGVADILSNYKQIKPGLAHAVFIFNVFLLHIQEWWYSYQYINEVRVWTLPLVLFLLLYPITLFLLARMLIPTGLRGHETDLEQYYYDQWQWFFGLHLAIVVTSFLQNVFVSGHPVSGQILLFLLSVVFISFLSFKITSKKAHNAFAIALAIAWIIIILLDTYELTN